MSELRVQPGDRTLVVVDGGLPVSWMAPVAATALAFVAGVLGWKGVDLPAQLYRVGLFHRQGLTLWDTQWYGGHWTLGYSVVFPPVAGLIGLRATEIVCAGIAAVAFDRLVVGHFGPGARAGSAVFALGTLVPVAIGQVPFLLGETLALVALWATVRQRWPLAIPLALGAALASPLAGAFLVLGTCAWLLGTWRSPGERRLCGRRGGHPHRRPRRSISRAGDDAVSRPRLRRRRDHLRRCRAVHPRPRAHPADRCGPVCRGVRCRVRPAVGARWQHRPAGRDPWTAARGVPPVARSAGRAHRSGRPAHPHQLGTGVECGRQSDQPVSKVPVLRARGGLRASPRQPARPGRDRPHSGTWEAAYAAPSVPLARGWERQLDTADNPIFYERGALTPQTYRSWLLDNGVRFVALADVKLDYAAVAEGRLVKHGVPGLRPVWHNTNWWVYEVQGSPGIVSGPARAVAIRGDTITLDVTAPGTIHLKERYSPRWAVTQGDGCTHEDSGGWLSIQAVRPGPMRAQLHLFGPPGDAC